jgi:ABC-2 type transport system ATP-binding protein
MTTAPAVLVADDVGYAYGVGTGGVSSLSLRLHAGRVTGFFGRNGAGKSTSMLLLAGVLIPQRGRVLLGGVDVKSAAARQRIAWAPEVPPLSFDLTVAEHLRLAMSLRSSSPTTAVDVDDAVARLELAVVWQRRAGALSKGTRQRLGVAMALVVGGDVLLLDEPTAGCDPGQVAAMRALILEARAKGVAVLLSSHVVVELAAVADDVVAIADGRTVFSGPVSAIADATAAALGAVHAVERHPPAAGGA